MSDATQSFYGRWARLYDVLATLPGVRSWRASATDELALDDGDLALEMGCGTGANLPHLRERVGPDGRVVGLDVTRGMLERARGRGSADLLQADAARPPIAEPVDGLLGTFVVAMFADPGSIVDGWCDLVRPVAGSRCCTSPEASAPGPVRSTPPTARSSGSPRPTSPGCGTSPQNHDRRVDTGLEALAARTTDYRERTLAGGSPAAGERGDSVIAPSAGDPESPTPTQAVKWVGRESPGMTHHVLISDSKSTTVDHDLQTEVLEGTTRPRLLSSPGPKRNCSGAGRRRRPHRRRGRARDRAHPRDRVAAGRRARRHRRRQRRPGGGRGPRRHGGSPPDVQHRRGGDPRARSCWPASVGCPATTARRGAASGTGPKVRRSGDSRGRPSGSWGSEKYPDASRRWSRASAVSCSPTTLRSRERRSVAQRRARRVRGPAVRR